MMQLLSAIEQSGFSTWVRESNSLLAYPGVLFLHTLGMGVVAGISGLIALRILGCAHEVPLADVRKMYPFMWVGFYVNAVTGVILFAIDATTKIIDPVFYIKLAFIAAALFMMHRIDREVFAYLLLEKRPVQMNGKILAFATVVCWTGVITAGRLLAYVAAGVISSSSRK